MGCYIYDEYMWNTQTHVGDRDACVVEVSGVGIQVRHVVIRNEERHTICAKEDPAHKDDDITCRRATSVDL